jgi:hypothetical protein
MGRLLAIYFYVIHTFTNSINDLSISFYYEMHLTLHVLCAANGRSFGAAMEAYAKEAKSGATGVFQL